jgi:hypothetical protein
MSVFTDLRGGAPVSYPFYQKYILTQRGYGGITAPHPGCYSTTNSPHSSREKMENQGWRCGKFLIQTGSGPKKTLNLNPANLVYE